MCKIVFKFTVFFEDPFWVGIYEREYNCKYEVCKITFGAEPKSYEIYDFMLKNWNKLRFSPSFESEAADEKHINPKRMQREINKQLHNTGVGTKAQLALKKQHEEGKIEHKIRSREENEAEKNKYFELKQAKRKAKHRGH